MAYLFANKDVLRVPYRLAVEMKGGNACEGPTTQDSHSEHLQRVHKKEAVMTPPLGTVPSGDPGLGRSSQACLFLGCSGKENERRPGSVATFLYGFGHEAQPL